VPSSTISTTSRSSSKSAQTQTHARALRVVLESLDDLQETRDKLVQRARIMSEADDIHPRILKAASGFERLAEVQPAMFEDISDEELAKYDKFLREIGENEQKQNAFLADIQVRGIFRMRRSDAETQ